MADDLLNHFGNTIVQHEGLEPDQTPFRITDPSMAKWKSMFDDTMRFKLNPNAKKGINRQNFLYAVNQEDIQPAVIEQFRRYSERNPNITIADAIRIFDQTGADGKIEHIEKQGISSKAKLSELFRMR